MEWIYTATQVATQPSRQGITWGQKSIFLGNLCVAPSEEGLVEIIQNLIDFALEGHLTAELLRQDVGIVVGFLLNHPEVLKTLSGGN